MFSWGPVLVKPTNWKEFLLWPIATLLRLMCAMAQNVGIKTERAPGRLVIGLPTRDGITCDNTFLWFFFKKARRLGINLSIFQNGETRVKLHVSVPYLFDIIITHGRHCFNWPDHWFGSDGTNCWKVVFYLWRFFEVKLNYRKNGYTYKGFNFQWEREKIPSMRYRVDPAGKMRGWTLVDATEHSAGSRISAEVVMEDVIGINRNGLVMPENIVRRYTVRAISPVYVLKHDPAGVKLPSLEHASEEQTIFVTTTVCSAAEALRDYGRYLTSLLK